MTQQETSNHTLQGSFRSEVFSLLLVIILALGVRTFILELFYVPTGSMKATILEGDYIFSTKYSYGYSIYSIPFNPDIFDDRIFANKPERGDVVIMRPPHDMQERYIKRLFGLPGDKIQIIDDLIYINDTPIERIEVGSYVDEEGMNFRKFKETLPNGSSYFSYKMKYPSTKVAVDHSNFGPYVVEPDINLAVYLLEISLLKEGLFSFQQSRHYGTQTKVFLDKLKELGLGLCL